jgi:phage recombination protein Bet
MSKNTQIALRPEEVEMTTEQIELIKTTVCKGATDNELRLFLYQCKRMGLDPLSRQVYGIKRWSNAEKREVMSIQTSIDGLRLIAERSGKYGGGTRTEWLGEDGKWVHAWVTKGKRPLAARAGVYKIGNQHPTEEVVIWDEIAALDKQGNPTKFWTRMPSKMLGKCAESAALRRAFPQELSGVYSHEEMEQADVQEAEFHQHNAIVAQENIQVLATLRDEDKEQEAAIAVQVQEIAAKIDKRCTPGLTQSLNTGLEKSGRIKPGGGWQSAGLKDLQSINGQFEKYAARALEAFPPINVIGPEELVEV